MMGSFSTGSVHCSQSSNGIKVGGGAREFIKNVISGIQDNKGEQWVRQQFYNYTKQFLDSVEVINTYVRHFQAMMLNQKQ